MRNYATRAKEEASTPDVITGTFTFHDTIVITSIDFGSTHSYICTTLATIKKMPIESIEVDIRVSNPIGQWVIVNEICRNCLLKILGNEFFVDLMLLPFDEFNAILGMDWWTIHDSVVNCKHKRITLKCSNGELLRVETKRSDYTTNLISMLKSQKFIHKGVEAFLVYILGTRTSEQKIDQVPTVREFMDVFHKSYRVYHRKERLNLPLRWLRGPLQFL